MGSSYPIKPPVPVSKCDLLWIPTIHIYRIPAVSVDLLWKRLGEVSQKMEGFILKLAEHASCWKPRGDPQSSICSCQWEEPLTKGKRVSISANDLGRVEANLHCQSLHDNPKGDCWWGTRGRKHAFASGELSWIDAETDAAIWVVNSDGISMRSDLVSSAFYTALAIYHTEHIANTHSLFHPTQLWTGEVEHCYVPSYADF
jgi:hypothetical protein